MASYQQFLQPVLFHHVAVDFKGRRRAEQLARTDAKDSTATLPYLLRHLLAYCGTWFFCIVVPISYFLPLPFLSKLCFIYSRLVLFPVPSYTATAGVPVKSLTDMACSVRDGSLEDDAPSGRSVTLTVMDGSGADSRQVGVGGQVRSAEDSSLL